MAFLAPVALEGAAGGAAAGGAEAGVAGGGARGLLGKFGPQALMGKVMGGKSEKPGTEHGGIIHSLTTGSPLASHASESYGAVLQPGQFG